MSKKSRRARSRSRVEQHIPAGVPEKKATMPVTPSQAVQLKNLNDSSNVAARELRYRHIIPELHRIAIIAGVLFMLLIILTIVIG